MKKLLSIVCAIVCAVGISFGLIGCRPYPEVFDKVNQIERHPDYALCNDFEYRSAEKSIIWKDVIEEKIKADGKKVEDMNGGTTLYLKEPNSLKGAFIVFSYKYRTDFNWFGLNKKNKHYAVGVLYLDDYFFSAHYYKLSYDKFYCQKVSQTQFSCYAEEDEEGEYILIDRENGKMKKTDWENFEDVERNFQGAFPKIYNQSTYTENGVTYMLRANSLSNEEENLSINCPTYEHVLERCEKLQQINTLIGGASDNSVQSSFATNGTELFILFQRTHAMFGYACDLPPIIFRCDTSFERFEYIGMLYQSYSNQECLIQIISLT